MFRQVLEFLDNDGWPVEPGELDGVPCILTRFEGTSTSWACRARPYDPYGQLLFESILPAELPSIVEERDALIGLLLRVNWRLLVGGFQIDWDSCEVVFRTALLLNGQSLTDELMKGVVYGNVFTMNRCIDEVLAAFHGERPVQECFERLAL